MKKIREVLVSGFAADANPNSSGLVPTSADVYSFTGLAADQIRTEGVEGHELAIRFVDNSNVEVPAATCNFRTWFYDPEQSALTALNRPAWVAMEQVTGAPSSQLHAVAKRGGKMFVQLLAITPGAATKVQVLVGESASVAG